MKEVWNGTPSQILNFTWFLRCFFGAIVLVIFTPKIVELMPAQTAPYLQIGLYFLAGLMILTLFWQIWFIRTYEYKITSEELTENFGVLTRRKERLALFRVKDISSIAPFYMRPFGLGNIILITSDHSTPVVNIMAIPNVANLEKVIRDLVNEQRKKHGVREFD